MTSPKDIAAAIFQVNKTRNVTDVTICKVVRNILRLSIKEAKTAAYNELKESEAAIRESFRSAEHDARVAAFTEVTADNLFAALAPQATIRPRTKTSDAEKTAVAENHQRNRAELEATLHELAVDAATLLNTLRRKHLNGELVVTKRKMTEAEVKSSTTVTEVPAAVETV